MCTEPGTAGAWHDGVWHAGTCVREPVLGKDNIVTTAIVGRPEQTFDVLVKHYLEHHRLNKGKKVAFIYKHKVNPGDLVLEVLPILTIGEVAEFTKTEGEPGVIWACYADKMHYLGATLSFSNCFSNC